MRSSIKALLGVTAAAALAATAASSIAQDGPPQAGRPGLAGPRAGGPGNPQMREQMMRQRLALRADQEAAFQAFLQATRPPGPGARGERREIRQLTTPERLDRQLAELRQRVDATKRFYAVLSPEQRQSFDAMPMGGPDGGRGPGRGGGRRAQGLGGPGGPGQDFGAPAPQ
jgi:Spy/CpxP family protein refolding chaperone